MFLFPTKKILATVLRNHQVFTRRFSLNDGTFLIGVIVDVILPPNIDLWTWNRKLTKLSHHASKNNCLLQGCVLSPVLFNICTASIHKKYLKKVEIFQYADDFLIIDTGDSREKAEDTLRQKAGHFIN